jgi:drug/metabolite transporter (DMT)-like permease
MNNKRLPPEEVKPLIAVDRSVPLPLSEDLLFSPTSEPEKIVVSTVSETATNQKTQSSILLIFSLFSALIAVSLAAIFKLSEKEIGPNATIFNRLWLATLVFGLWNSFAAVKAKFSMDKRVERSEYTLRDLVLLIGVGVVSSASLAFWAWSLTKTNVANSTVLRNLTPLFTTFGSWLFLGRSFDSKFLIGLAIAMCGAIAIGIDDLQIGADNLTGDFAALLAAVFYASNLLLSEQLRTKFSATSILMWRCLIGTILIFPLVVITEYQIFPSSWQGWLAVIALAVICQAFGQGLLINSLGKLSSGFVAIFLLLEPVITAILAWIIFSESLSLLNWLAFCVVLVGIYLAKSSPSVNKAPKQKKIVNNF